MTQTPTSPQLDAIAAEGLFLKPEWRFRPWGQLQRKPLRLKAGRGQLALIDHPRGVLAERSYRHGGLRRLVFANWFWHSARASHEFAMHRQAFENRIPTVEPVGWREATCWIPGWRKYWFYTVYLPGAVPLPQALKEGSPAQSMVRQVGPILKSLYRLGIYHTDLNLNNWLIWVGHLRLIDFDGAKLVDWDPNTYALACLKRMARSGVKLGFGQSRALFFRLTISIARAFHLEPRHLLSALPPEIGHISKWRELRWRISGGHR